MGLSSKQVANDRHGWNQALLQASTLELPKPSSMKRPSSQVQQQQTQQQQGVEQLKCPRCESTNTKFCYYNNYNKSQPRHFCKACKRHWTKGGTLRNVPVGGGRKNKRLKTSNSGVKATAAAAASKTNNNNSITITSTNTTTTTNDNIKMLIQSQPQQPRFSLPLVGLSSSSSSPLGGGYDDKNFTQEFYKTLVRQPAATLSTTSPPLPDSSITFNHLKGLNNDDSLFMGATQQQQQQQSLQFPYSNLGSSFESSNNNNNNNPCSISSSSPNFYTFTGDHLPNNGLEETVLNSLNNNNTSLSSSSMSDHHQPWNATTTTTTPTRSNMMDISSNWGWDDFDKFVTVDADLTMPWDDDDDDHNHHSDIKPSGP